MDLVHGILLIFRTAILLDTFELLQLPLLNVEPAEVLYLGLPNI